MWLGVVPFFFSSRRRHTSWPRDWSSDVCSSDLRPAQQVGLSERVPGEGLRDRHHLLLVDDQAVGGAEHLLQGFGQLRVDRGDRLLTVLAQRVVGVRVRDRKSTRLNSSHVAISYAVFCL